MGKNFLLCIIFLLLGLKLFAQEENISRLNFILFIDDEIPRVGIIEGSFLIKHNTQILDSIPFKYEVGELKIFASDYKKLFSLSHDEQVEFKFKYQIFFPKTIEKNYISNIPSDWINKEYMIFKVYNFSKKNNRKKFVFGRKKYLVKIIIPGSETLLITR